MNNTKSLLGSGALIATGQHERTMTATSFGRKSATHAQPVALVGKAGEEKLMVTGENRADPKQPYQPVAFRKLVSEGQKVGMVSSICP